jgi:hypothetical protein
VRNWPKFKEMDVRKISEKDCLEWASDFAKKYSSSVFKNTVGTLRHILAVGISEGVCYGNPGLVVKKARLRKKNLKLPEHDKLLKLVETVRLAGSCG